MYILFISFLIIEMPKLLEVSLQKDQNCKLAYL